MTTSAIITILRAGLIGMHKNKGSAEITKAGWLKFSRTDNNGNELNTYKNRIGFTVSDKRAPGGELNQYADLIVFGKRGDWLAENLTPGTQLPIVANFKMEEFTRKDGTTGQSMVLSLIETSLYRTSDTAERAPGATTAAPAASAAPIEEDPMPF